MRRGWLGESLREMINVAIQLGAQDSTTHTLLKAWVATGKESVLNALARRVGWQIIDRGTTMLPFQSLRPGELAGPFLLGRDIMSGAEVRPAPHEMNVLVVGATGFGKSNLSSNITLQTHAQSMYGLIFDPKRDHRHLIRRIPDMRVVRLDQIPFNPFLPGHSLAPHRRWPHAMKVLETFVEPWELLGGSTSQATPVVMGLVESWDHSGCPPTVRDFLVKTKEVMRKHRPGSPNHSFCERLVNRTEAYLSVFGRCADVLTGWPIEELLNTLLVIETDAIDSRQARAQVCQILNAVLELRMTEGKRNRETKHVIQIDEAHSLLTCPDERLLAGGRSFIDTFLAEIGEFSEGVWLFNQTTRTGGHGILDNTHVKVLFQVGNGFDVETIARATRLTPEQSAYATRLGRGEAIVKMSSHPEPFVIRTPLCDVVKDVGDSEVRVHCADWMQRMNANVGFPPKHEVEDRSPLTMDHEAFLRILAPFPFTLAEVTRRAKLGTQRSLILRDDLSSRTLIQIVTATEIGRGGMKAVMGLTDGGREYLRSRGVQVPAYPRGGIIHAFIIRLVKEYLEQQGAEVEVEAMLREGVWVDLLVKRGELKPIAIEVEVSCEQAGRNALKVQGIVEEVLLLVHPAKRKKEVVDAITMLGLVDTNTRVRVECVQDALAGRVDFTLGSSEE